MVAHQTGGQWRCGGDDELWAQGSTVHVEEMVSAQRSRKCMQRSGSQIIRISAAVSQTTLHQRVQNGSGGSDKERFHPADRLHGAKPKFSSLGPLWF